MQKAKSPGEAAATEQSPRTTQKKRQDSENTVPEDSKNYQLGRAMRSFRACADSEGPDQPAHPRRLIRALAFCLHNHLTPQNVSMESKCPDETLRMRGMNLCILRMLEDTVSRDAA